MRTEPSMIGFTTTASVKTANVEYIFIIEMEETERNRIEIKSDIPSYYSLEVSGVVEGC